MGFWLGGADLEGDEAMPHFALLQSTGLLTTGKHIFANFCLGRSGRQLLLSSTVISLLEDGTHA